MGVVVVSSILMAMGVVSDGQLSAFLSSYSESSVTTVISSEDNVTSFIATVASSGVQ